MFHFKRDNWLENWTITFNKQNVLKIYTIQDCLLLVNQCLMLSYKSFAAVHLNKLLAVDFIKKELSDI